MSKYIIDTDQFEKLFETKAVAVLGIGDNPAVHEEGEKTVWTRMFNAADLEELTSDYINEHFGDLQDTAYQRGLNEAWECGKKLAWTAKYGGYGERLSDVFGRDDTFDFYDYTPNEAIAKLKAYEEKQEAADKIEVGDEVEPFYTDITGVVTLIDGDTIYVLWRDGLSTSTLKLKEVTKAGRHYNINEILGGLCDD